MTQKITENSIEQDLQDSNDVIYCSRCEDPLLDGESHVCGDCGETLCLKCFFKGEDFVKCQEVTAEFKENLLNEPEQCVLCFRAENQICSTCAKYVPCSENDSDDAGLCSSGNPTDDVPDTDQGDCDDWEDKDKWELRLVPKGFPKEKLEVLVIYDLKDSERHYGKIISTEAFGEKIRDCIKQMQATLPNYCPEDLFVALEKAGVPFFDYDEREEDF